MPNKPSAVANAIGHIDDRAGVLANDDAGEPCRASLKGMPFTCTRTTPYNPRHPVNTHSSDLHSAGAVNSRASAGRSSRAGASASLSDRMGSRTGQSISSAGSFQRMLRSALGTYTSVHL